MATQFGPEHDVRIARIAGSLVTLGLWEHGGTVNWKGQNADYLRVGYVVGGKYPTLVLPVPRNGDEVLAAIVKVEDWYRTHAGLDDAFTGSWEHAGELYFDFVDVIDTLPFALALAAKQGQAAVWDLANGEEIYVTEGGNGEAA